MQPNKKNKGRQWKHRPKVSSNLSKDFPWEVVLRFLRDHPRSLILLQMVDKNLKNLISTDDGLWLSKFNKEIKNTAFCNRTVKDPLYPNLRLWKPHLHGLPVYMGPLRGDSDDSSLGFAFDASFSSYVRRVFALKHGTKCGMCGCRHRHELYWSLRMRVCRLCMEANSITGEALSRKYGVDYSDLLCQHKGKFFFYSLSAAGMDDKMSLDSMARADLGVRYMTHLLWLPHLRTLLDFDALHKQQILRRLAAKLLSGLAKRQWVTSVRALFYPKKCSIDCLLLELYRNEKKRVFTPYGLRNPPGGHYWAFPACHSRTGSKFGTRNNEPLARVHSLMGEYEDCVV
jgi:hypothetical protein